MFCCGIIGLQETKHLIVDVRSFKVSFAIFECKDKLSCFKLDLEIWSQSDEAYLISDIIWAWVNNKIIWRPAGTERFKTLKPSMTLYNAFKPNSTIKIFDEISHLLMENDYNVKTQP